MEKSGSCSTSGLYTCMDRKNEWSVLANTMYSGTSDKGHSMLRTQ